MKVSSWLFLSASFLATGPSFAQTTDVADPEPSTPEKAGEEETTDVTPGPEEPSETAEASDSPPQPRPEPPKDSLDVDDPMLAPVAPPKKILSDWREAIEMVRSQSSDYIQAQAQVEEARGQSRMALANVLPTLVGTGNVGYHMITETTGPDLNATPPLAQAVTLPDPRGSWTINATLTIPLLNVRNWYDYATTRDVIKQGQMTRDDAERLIIGGLAQSMVTVITMERLSEVTRVNLAAALSTLDLNKRRARLGAGSAVDVLRSKQEVARSRAQVVQADENLRQAREALGQALGLAEPVGITPDLRMDQLRQDARDTCSPGESPMERADVRAAEAGAAIAKRNVKSVMFSYLPTIDATTTVQRLSGVNPFFPDTTWTIGAQLTWRLYDGGLRYGEKQRNQARLVQAEETARNTARLATIEAIQAARGVQVAQTSLEISQESRAIAQDNAKLARAKFINGSGTSFDMVDTQSTAREAELDVTVKEFELLRAEIIAFLALASCDL